MTSVLNHWATWAFLVAFAVTGALSHLARQPSPKPPQPAKFIHLIKE